MPRPSPRKPKEKPAPHLDVPVSRGNLWLHTLESRVFGNTRLVRVWLPSDYDGWGATRYPVLYLNDGQNLFEPATAFAGVHWQVGEAATRLIAENKIRPLIIVGIDNAGRNRAREYIPYKSRDPRVVQAFGCRYPEFLQSEVMPLIAPGIFGRLLIESPSLFVANRKILSGARDCNAWPSRVFLGMGTREAGNPEKDAKTVDDARELAAILRTAGLGEDRLRVRIAEGATHTESAWAARFPEALEFLYSDTPAGVSSDLRMPPGSQPAGGRV